MSSLPATLGWPRKEYIPFTRAGSAFASKAFDMAIAQEVPM